MDFTPHPEQIERNAHLERFARDFARNWRPNGTFSRSGWAALTELGLAGLPVPARFGGSELTALETVQSFETVAKYIPDLGLLFSLSAHLFACVVPLWRGGSETQKERWLEPLACGRLIAANAISEEGSGSDVYAMASQARAEGDDYIINGTKRFTTNAPIADVVIAYARTDPKSTLFGISCFLIPVDTPGLQIVSEQPKSGLQTSPWGGVHFNNCRVSAQMRIGPEGAGATLFHESMIWERGCLFAIYLGAMQRIYQLCLEHARNRVQFGRPIGSNQAISDRLVDMCLRIETARLLLYKAAWLYDQGQPYEQAIALSKLWISESSVKMAEDAMQIFGGEAMTASHPVNQFLNDAMPARIFSGSSEIQREIIARSMKLR
jgi:L-prolyl-PCP dehydrogenase